MDNRTVQRALQGDAEASRQLEAHLRAAARQLLEHPALEVGDEVHQRVLANAAVAESMERELRDLDTLTAATVLVSVALVPQILASASRKAAEEHLSGCADCTDQARAVRDAAAAIDQDIEEPTAQHHVAVIMDGTRAVAQLGQDDDGDAASAAEAMLQSLLETADAVDAARDAEPSSRRRRRRRRGRRERSISMVPLGLFAAVLVFLAVRLDFSACSHEPTGPTLRPELAALAELELPERPEPGSWPDALEPAFDELESGNCAMAADRFRLARYRGTSGELVWYWEGLAAACGGRGGQAVDALQAARALNATLPDIDWYLAQAALLAGQADVAQRQLHMVCTGTSRRVAEACAQLARIDEG
jgi:hypothetical protein